MPFFRLVTKQAAANHELSGVRVPSKIVPAVTDVLRKQPPHLHHRPLAICHPPDAPDEKRKSEQRA